jgi:hypothetical protein
MHLGPARDEWGRSSPRRGLSGGGFMRRIAAMMVTCVLLVATGCSNRYQVRLDETLKEMKYNKRLDDNLEAAPAEGKLKELDIFVRPPKPMAASKEFLLGEVPAGQFDDTKTFFEGQKAFLHVIARKKQAKKPVAKGAAPEPQAARGPFNTDVIAVLKAIYPDEESLAPEKFKDDPKKGNAFKRVIFENSGKRVEVYLYKLEPYDVALIFQYDPAEKAALASKINLCLESFAIGPKAHAKYANPNGSGEEESSEPSGPAAF